VPKGATAPTSPRKPKLGQHFLVGEGAALRIVEALGDVSEATVAGDWAGRALSHRPAGTKGAAADCGGIGPRPVGAVADEIQHATQC